MNEIETLQNRIKELESENEQLKKDLEHARSYKHTITMQNRNLRIENEKLKGELEMEHDDCSNAKKCEVEYHKAYDKELDENVTLRKENAKILCLALHAMSEYSFAQGTIIHTKLEFAEQSIEEDRKMIHKINIRDRWGEYFAEAYRKAKEELKEGK